MSLIIIVCISIMRLLFIESGDLDLYMFCALLIILSLVMKLLCSENLHVKGTNITLYNFK